MIKNTWVWKFINTHHVCVCVARYVRPVRGSVADWSRRTTRRLYRPVIVQWRNCCICARSGLFAVCRYCWRNWSILYVLYNFLYRDLICLDHLGNKSYETEMFFLPHMNGETPRAVRRVFDMDVRHLKRRFWKFMTDRF